ncbi:hypothetical protein GALMADRAFT_65876 [Galerina marginata CBS 339.88]|uniref:Ricin B lectin domain-containing protein n=1 Tax=Galerina marginata (strain CBS 339.88) TaxID=685588 RepID=A0A067T5T3_GALM3|nr:hypothetical protein GALMADRAFT_65876 [Galerina marginata CBS 339.88]
MAFNIHPNGDNTKCIGIVGGVYADGTAVDIYDCDHSNTQKWQSNGNVLTSVSPNGSQWCLDAGVRSNWASGVKMKIWQCIYTLPQQSWTPITASTAGSIKLTGSNFCLDLTDGRKVNRNILQIWECSGGNANQRWTVTSA